MFSFDVNGDLLGGETVVVAKRREGTFTNIDIESTNAVALAAVRKIYISLCITYLNFCRTAKLNVRVIQRVEPTR